MQGRDVPAGRRARTLPIESQIQLSWRLAQTQGQGSRRLECAAPSPPTHRVLRTSGTALSFIPEIVEFVRGFAAASLAGAAKTKHGRYSSGPATVASRLSEKGIESPRSFPVRESRSELLRRVREPLSCDVVDNLREIVRRELAVTEQRRLDRWHQRKG